MKHTDNDNFIVTKTDAANNGLLVLKRFAWREVCESASVLTEIDEVAQYEHPCTLVEMLDSKFLSTVLDDSQITWPLWFVKLPGALWPHAQELAVRFPHAINRESDDLLHKHTYYFSLVVPNDGCTSRTGCRACRSQCNQHVSLPSRTPPIMSLCWEGRAFAAAAPRRFRPAGRASRKAWAKGG